MFTVVEDGFFDSEDGLADLELGVLLGERGDLGKVEGVEVAADHVQSEVRKGWRDERRRDGVHFDWVGGDFDDQGAEEVEAKETGGDGD